MSCFKVFLKVLAATSVGALIAATVMFGAGWVFWQIEQAYGLLATIISVLVFSAVATAAIVTPFHCGDWE